MLLEVGKSYFNGEGDVRKIVLKRSGYYYYPFVDDQGDTYSDSGKYLMDGEPHRFDLVEEVK